MFSRRDAHFERYCGRVSQTEELDGEAERALARAYAAGDRRAGERLLEAHLRDVVAIARSYRGYGHPMAELVAEGNVGLTRALEGYDPERGLRFMTYGRYWVRAAILAHVQRSWSLVRIGSSSTQTRIFFGLNQARRRLELGADEDECDALARYFDCSATSVETMRQRVDSRDLSLDQPRPSRAGTSSGGSRDSGSSLGDSLPGDRSCAEEQLFDRELSALVRHRVAIVVRELDARERVIIQRRLLSDEPISLVELGAELGISRERVRQLEQRVKSKLRRRLFDVAADLWPARGRARSAA